MVMKKNCLNSPSLWIQFAKFNTLMEAGDIRVMCCVSTMKEAQVVLVCVSAYLNSKLSEIEKVSPGVLRVQYSWDFITD